MFGNGTLRGTPVPRMDERRHMPRPEALKRGACSAAASLSEVSASDGVKTKDEVLKLYELYGKK